ncbi:MAG TPA: tail fiber domain-containing protein [Candidatus Paceibacterota bacterium]|nr:tail fiber domain-containing protein [Candidatus Paceibacterota bacterium]
MFERRYNFLSKSIYAILAVFILGVFSFSVAHAAAGVPNIISYQGRLTDSNGVLLGGTGTNYYFKFSIWDNPTVGSGAKLWPSGSPGTATLSVTNGVFDVNIGDTGSGYPDALTYNFQDNDTVYLQVEVSSNNITFETLGPRGRITSSGAAINAKTLGGIDSSLYALLNSPTFTGTVTLPAGTNIKTINSSSLLGSGDISIAPDQTVAISAGTNITSVTGTYPNFTINAATQTTDISGKQDTLVSGTNIKTINSNNLLGAGDISVASLIGYTPYNATNPAGYISGITGSDVNTALGFTPEDVANKSTNTSLGTSNTLYPTQNAVKTYVDNNAMGLNWKTGLQAVNVIANSATPVGTTVEGDGYIIDTGGNTGVWSAFAPGDIVEYKNGAWVKLDSLVLGDRFGVALVSSTAPFGTFAGFKDYIFNVTGGTPGAFTYTGIAPTSGDARFVENSSSLYYGISFTYSGTLAKWVQLSANVNLSYGNGLQNISNVLSLGPLTQDWNQTAPYNIVLNNSSAGLKMLENGPSPTLFGIFDVAHLSSSDKTYTFPDLTGTVALTTNNLSAFAATTSAQLAGVISDETGSGSLVFGNSPTLATPNLGTPSALVGTNITGTAAGLTAGTVTNGVYTTDAGTVFLAPNGNGSSLTGLTKSQVGLSNVDNTSDANKPISTATQTALNAKQNTITTGTTSQYFRGDLSLATFPTALSSFTNDLGNYGGFLTSAGTSAGTYNNVTVGTSGLVTSGSNVAYLTSASLTGYLQNNVGIAGGTTLVGDTAASGNLTLTSTSNATKGLIIMGASAYDETNNRLGIGTTAPLTKLQVVTTDTSDPRGIVSSQINNGTNSARLGFWKARGTPSALLSVNTGDMLGRLLFRGYDGASYLEMGSIDVGVSGTVASTRIPTYLSFSTATDASPSVLTEAMRIDSAQKVGIGITAPNYKLDVNGDVNIATGSHYKINGTNLTYSDVGALAVGGTAVAVSNATFTTTFTNNGGAGTLTWPAAGATLTIPTGGGTLGSAAFTNANAYEVPLTFSTGLTRSTNTITDNLATGIAGGQTVYGGTAAGENLTLNSTSNATKGKIFFGASSAYDGANIRLGINNTSPVATLDVKSLATRSAVVFSGSGTNDATAGGTYVGNTNSSYVVTISEINPVKTVAKSVGGSGYTVNDVLTLTGGNGAATVKVTSLSSGGCNAMTLLTGGSGYSTGVVATTGGTGTGCTVNISALQGYDMFTWNVDGGASSADTAITLAAQALSNGVTVTFGGKLTHGIGATWTITTTVNVPTLNVADANGGSLFSVYNAGSIGTANPLSILIGARPPAMTGDKNVGIGIGAMNVLTSGSQNIAIGWNTLAANISGGNNTAVGNGALAKTTTTGNTAFGTNALPNVTAAGANVAVGVSALSSFTNGSGNNGSNTGIGNSAGSSITVGYQNTFLGANAGSNASQLVGAINSMALGNAAYTTASNQVVIGNSSITTLGIGTSTPTNILSFGAGADRTMWIENSATDVAPNNLTIQSGSTVAGTSVSNVVGGNLLLNSGLGTGTGASNIIFSTGKTLGSGTTLQTMTEAMRILGNGDVGISNTAPGYLLHVGSASTTANIIVGRFQTSAGTCDVVPISSGFACSSDMNLKKNVNTLDGMAWTETELGTTPITTLDKILALVPVTYNWKVEQDTDAKHAGFIAQDVKQIFPDLVSTDPNTNLLSLNYLGMMPYAVKAIQEMDLKIKDLSSLDTTSATSLGSLITQFLADQANGIADLYAKTIHSSNEICINNTCIDEAQLIQILNNAHVSSTADNSGSSAPSATEPATTDSTVPASDSTAPASDSSVTPPADDTTVPPSDQVVTPPAAPDSTSAPDPVVPPSDAAN